LERQDVSREKQNMNFTILVADPTPGMRQALQARLAGQEDFVVIGEAADGTDVLRLARELNPHLIILDIEILDFAGLESTRQLIAQLPGVKVMALAMHTDKRFVKQALDAGVSGYLLKDCVHEELLPAVQQIKDGQIYISPGVEVVSRGNTITSEKYSLNTSVFLNKEKCMSYEKKVKDFMIPLEDYPHIPYWFTLRQAMAIVREASIKFEGSFEPRALLVFDEKYQLMGMLTLRDIIRGLEPKFAQNIGLVKADPNLAVLLGDTFGPNLKEQSQKAVSEVMSPIKVTVNGEDPITKAIFLMIQENVGMMPVLLDQKVVGMIRLSELFKEISAVVLGE
jgi:DNA-binding NarL/FixJ family response regulator/CBS domain-containing protein